MWRDDVPAFSLLWLSQPDKTQHDFAPGADVSLAAPPPDQRTAHGLRPDPGWDQRGHDAAHGERRCGRGADGGYGRRREDAGRQTPGDETVEHDLHGVLARQYDPAVGRKARECGAQRAEGLERLDSNDGSKHGDGPAIFQRSHQIAGLFARARNDDAAPLQGTSHAPLQSHRGPTHYQAMLRDIRAAFARYCPRRAAACQREAPRRAVAWLKLGCRFAPGYADTFPALVHLSRALERWTS